MKAIALKFTFHTDVIEVPDNIAESIRKIQSEFDEWLYDKSIDHDCWIKVDGEKRLVSFDTLDFVNYINTYILVDGDEKAIIVHQNLRKTPKGMPIIFF